VDDRDAEGGWPRRGEEGARLILGGRSWFVGFEPLERLAQVPPSRSLVREASRPRSGARDAVGRRVSASRAPTAPSQGSRAGEVLWIGNRAGHA